MKALWDFFNGHKTIIFSIIFSILQSGILTFMSPELTTVLLAIVGALGGASLIHHVAKAAGEDK